MKYCKSIVFLYIHVYVMLFTCYCILYILCTIPNPSPISCHDIYVFYTISIVYFQCIIVNALWNENITLIAYSSQQNSSNYSSHPQFIIRVNGTQCLYLQNSSNYSSHPQFIIRVNGTQCLYLHFSFDNG